MHLGVKNSIRSDQWSCYGDTPSVLPQHEVVDPNPVLDFH